VRRLYSTFAYGAPGVGLLLLRLAAGMTLVVLAIKMLLEGAHGGMGVFDVGSILSGTLLILGLWTPVAGTVVAIGAIWMGISGAFSLPSCIFVGILGAALALLGPGAFSLDASLYGWKRIELTAPKQKDGASK
jgi:putative oxidoreductase